MVCSDYVPLPPTLLAKTHPWNSCKLASTLVLLLAAPKDADAMHAALRWQSRTLGGLPTMSVIKTTPSADLSARVAMAKQAAFNGKVPTCTVLGVSLVDVEMIERGENLNKTTGYSSFAHAFVLGIGREGWYLYQLWVEHGYTLQDWLERGSGQMREWKEVKPWLKNFAVLATVEGEWSQKINDAYEKCFEVNVLRICDQHGPQEPIVPIYRPWVRWHEIVDVKDADVEKFTWE